MSQGGSSTNAAPGLTLVGKGGVASPFVKNDGSASEHVKAELAFYGRTLLELLRMEAEHQFGPLHYKNEAEEATLVAQGTCVPEA